MFKILSHVNSFDLELCEIDQLASRSNVSGRNSPKRKNTATPLFGKTNPCKRPCSAPLSSDRIQSLNPERSRSTTPAPTSNSSHYSLESGLESGFSDLQISQHSSS